MSLKTFLQSKQFIIIIGGIFMLALLAGAFQVGELVGYHKARFSYAWSDHYDRNFGGQHGGIMGMPMGGMRFSGAHGIFGSIIKLDDNSLVIQGRDREESIVTDANTVIKKFNQTLTLSDLKITDKIVIIGDPDDQGEVLAKLIRVLPN